MDVNDWNAWNVVSVVVKETKRSGKKRRSSARKRKARAVSFSCCKKLLIARSILPYSSTSKSMDLHLFTLIMRSSILDAMQWISNGCLFLNIHNAYL